MYWHIIQPVTIGVRCILIAEGKVILVRHTYQDAWFLPGGGVKRHETLEQAARREAAEETGATLRELTLFGIFTSFQENKSDHIAVFICRDFTWTGKGDNEIEQVKLFSFDELPADIAPGHARRIAEFIAAQANHGFGEW